MNLRKLDKLILRSFIGPLVLTLFIVVFILLIQLMLNKMDEFVGKDLGVMVLSELMFYFSINISQTALPLAVLLSSLMSFGNLGEFSELTAIKGAGISLLRAMRPAFILTVIITILAFLNNNYVVTKANLKAYSLLYDIKKHKPSLDIKEGTFYNGIPDFSIKVNKKFSDGETLGDIIIYEHSGNTGNNVVTFADSGRMYSVLNNRYLMFELYDGKRYEEIPKSGVGNQGISDFIRNDFGKSKLVLSLASFDFKKSREDLWTNHYFMKNITQLKTDVDSMNQGLTDTKLAVFEDAQRIFGKYYRNRVLIPEEYIARKHYKDSVNLVKQKADSIKYRDSYNKDLEEINRDSIEFDPGDSLEGVTEVAGQAQTLSNTANDGLASVNRDSIYFDRSRPEPATTSVPVQPQISVDASDAGVQPVKSVKRPVRNTTRFSKLNQTPVPEQIEKASYPKDADNPQDIKMSPRDLIKLKPVSEINVDSIFSVPRNQRQGLRHALSETRNIKNKLSLQSNRLENQRLLITKYKIEVNKKYAQAFACLVMFLIGAPLGSIIKKGGLGVPVIISIIFFILYYVMSITGKKWAEEDFVTPFMGIWGYSFFLLPVGFFFLRQAKNDARLLESDFYSVALDKLRVRLFKSRNQNQP